MDTFVLGHGQTFLWPIGPHTYHHPGTGESMNAVYEHRLPRWLVNSQGKIACSLCESPGTSFIVRGKETVPGSGVSQDEKNSCMMKIG